MKGANVTTLFVFLVLWVLLTVHPKDEGDRPYDDRYIQSVTEYNHKKYEKYLGPVVALEATVEEEATTPEEEQEFTE